MRLERTAFLFSRSELEALLELTDSPRLPFYPGVPSDLEEGLASLERASLAQRAGEQVLLDRVTAFLAGSVGHSESCVCMVGDGVYYGIFFREAVSVLLELRESMWLLTPFPDAEEATRAFEESLPWPEGAVFLGLRVGQTALLRPCEPDAVRAAALDAVARAQTMRPLTEEEQLQWKP